MENTGIKNAKIDEQTGEGYGGVVYDKDLWRLIKFRNLCPSEALWWPLGKLYRLFTGTVYISEERSVLNKVKNVERLTFKVES